MMKLWQLGVTKKKKKNKQISNQICNNMVELLTTKIVLFYEVHNIILLTEFYGLALTLSFFLHVLTFDCEPENDQK
jgi:hypothetical protein